MANIVLEENRNLRLVNYANNNPCDLTDLAFYIPTQYQLYQIFAVVIDPNNVLDVCKMTCTNDTTNYCIYNFSSDISLRIQSGKSHIYLVLINPQTMESITSCDITLNILIDKAKLSYHLLVTEFLSQQLADTYFKIQQLADLNIELYEKNLKLHLKEN